MTLERYLRLVGGLVVMLSLALARWVDGRFLLMTLFVGANLFQSALTNWCPLVPILGRLGVRSEAAAPRGETVKPSLRWGGAPTNRIRRGGAVSTAPVGSEEREIPAL